MAGRRLWLGQSPAAPFSALAGLPNQTRQKTWMLVVYSLQAELQKRTCATSAPSASPSVATAAAMHEMAHSFTSWSWSCCEGVFRMGEKNKIRSGPGG